MRTDNVVKLVKPAMPMNDCSPRLTLQVLSVMRFDKRLLSTSGSDSKLKTEETRAFCADEFLQW